MDSLTEREILLLLKQSVDDLKAAMSELKQNIVQTYATKAESAAVSQIVGLCATKAEVEVLRTELKPYLGAWNQITKMAIGAIGGGVLALLGYAQFIK